MSVIESIVPKTWGIQLRKFVGPFLSAVCLFYNKSWGTKNVSKYHYDAL